MCSINAQDHWKLEDMYPTYAEWRKDLEELKALGAQLSAWKGKAAGSAEALLKTARLYEELGAKMERLSVFAHSNFDQNMSDAPAKELMETCESTISAIDESLAFLAPELMSYTPEDFDRYCQEEPELVRYRQFARDFFAKKAHILDDRMEEFIVRMGDLSDSYNKIFDDLTVNDTVHPDIPGPDGTPVTVTEAGYGATMISPDRDFRKNYFNTMLGLYGSKINTLSSNYYAYVKSNVYIAKGRSYPTARAQSLAENHIPEEVYDTLVATARGGTAPLRDYVSLRKKTLGIEDFHFYDFFLPIVPDVDREYPFEEGRDLVLKATAVLGEDYTAVLKQALDERWIDRYPAKNKVSGAYSTSAYGAHPFMLLNYTKTLDSVFTLAHELGHAMHSWFSTRNQPFIYSNYTLFCAEVASTTNELLLHHYLLEHCGSREMKALLLAKHLDDLRSTFYRQTMFADFEYQTHTLAEQGEPLLPQTLCGIHQQLNRDYYGPELVVDDTLGYEWARIPHFYRAFYVYQYATGISAAIAIARRITSGVSGAVEDYRKFLTTGGSLHPIDELRIAGVDMSRQESVQSTVDQFAATLEQLKELL
mgnify:FL=1